jgi:hypothetical protein
LNKSCCQPKFVPWTDQPTKDINTYKPTLFPFYSEGHVAEVPQYFSPPPIPLQLTLCLLQHFLSHSSFEVSPQAWPSWRRGHSLGLDDTLGDKLGSDDGRADLEGVKLGWDDGDELGSDDGSLDLEGVKLGWDDGDELGSDDGSLDLEGVKLGWDDGDELGSGDDEESLLLLLLLLLLRFCRRCRRCS